MSIIQLMIALFLNQYLHEHYFPVSSVPSEEKKAVFVYFGTFTRALFSMFEITLGNWPPAIRILAESVTEWFFVFGVLVKLSIGFAVIGVINGVFMQETFKIASMDDVLMVRQKQRAMTEHARKMKRFLEEADRMESEDGGDDQISRSEWLAIVNHPSVKLWLASMELDTSDASNLFSFIDQSNDGQITLDELVKGVAKLRGPARSMDLTVLMREHNSLSHTVKALEKTLQNCGLAEKWSRI